jgi:predicted dinucleotide-binding enzyme
MEIGTIGAGDWAQAFAKRALKAGHKVKLSNRRGPDSLRQIVDQLGPEATAVTKEEAAACEIVLLAVPWDNVPETLAGLPKWRNQVLIDGTISADDVEAKKRVEILLKELGYSVIDLGNLRHGGLLQQAGGPLAGRDLLERED